MNVNETILLIFKSSKSILGQRWEPKIRRRLRKVKHLRLCINQRLHTILGFYCVSSHYHKLRVILANLDSRRKRWVLYIMRNCLRLYPVYKCLIYGCHVLLVWERLRIFWLGIGTRILHALCNRQLLTTLIKYWALWGKGQRFDRGSQRRRLDHLLQLAWGLMTWVLIRFF